MPVRAVAFGEAMLRLSPPGRLRLEQAFALDVALSDNPGIRR